MRAPAQDVNDSGEAARTSVCASLRKKFATVPFDGVHLSLSLRRGFPTQAHTRKEASS